MGNFRLISEAKKHGLSVLIDQRDLESWKKRRRDSLIRDVFKDGQDAFFGLSSGERLSFLLCLSQTERKPNV